MRAYEKALEELSFPQVQYTRIGGDFYGEAAATTAPAAGAAGAAVGENKMGMGMMAIGAAGQLIGGIVGMNVAQKQSEAEMAMQEQIAKDQMLINAQLASAEAAKAQQHAQNMPIYIIGGVVGLAVLGVTLKGLAEAKAKAKG